MLTIMCRVHFEVGPAACRNCKSTSVDAGTANVQELQYKFTCAGNRSKNKHRTAAGAAVEYQFRDLLPVAIR
jgi:hypothetical protein